MTTFQLPPSRITPRVVLDKASNRLLFEGDCYPENPLVFFAPFLQAVESHLTSSRPEAFVAEFRLRYVNSASTVTLQRLFSLLDGAGRAGADVHVSWVHDVDDDVNEELGHDVSRGCKHLELVHLATDEDRRPTP
jgi:hypothetical protein